MKKTCSGLLVALVACTLFINLSSCRKETIVTATTPSDILQSANWITTLVKDSVNTDVTAANQAYVGYAVYRKDGSFTITDLSGNLRSSGTWAVTADGKKRILVTSAFTRIVDIVTLKEDLFIYKIVNVTGNTVTVEHKPVK